MFEVVRTIINEKSNICKYKNTNIGTFETIREAAYVVDYLYNVAISLNKENVYYNKGNICLMVNDGLTATKENDGTVKFALANPDTNINSYDITFDHIVDDGTYAEIDISAEYNGDNWDDVVVTFEVVRSKNHSLDLTKLNVKLDPNAICPTRAHSDDAGLDLYTPYFVIIPGNSRTVIDTGVHVDIPVGYVGKIESKSGLMSKKGITCEGTIDAGYHGSLKAVVFNNSDSPAVFDEGDKITQLVIYPIATPDVEIVDSFDYYTERGNGGFGSTGK